MPKERDTSPRSGLAVFRELLTVEMQFGWTRWFGFACVLIWIFGLYWSNSLVSSFPGPFGNTLVSRDLWLGAEAVTLLGALLVMRRNKDCLGSRGVRWAAGLLVTAGSALAILGSLADAPGALIIGGILLTGVGSALLLVLWGVTLSERGPQTLLISIGFALMIASFIDFGLVYVPLAAQALCTLVVPVASSALLVFNSTERALNPAPPFILGAPAIAANPKTLSWRVVLLPAFVGLAYGLMQQLASAASLQAAPISDLRTISAFFMSGAVILVTTMFFSQDRVAQRIYFIALPIMVTTFLVLPVFENHMADLQTIFIIGFNCFYFMVWALWSGYRDESRSAVSRRFVVGLLVLIGSEALGLFLGSFVVHAQTTMNIPISTVSLLVVYALLMDALFTSNQLFGGTLSFGRQPRGREDAEGVADGAAAEGAGERAGADAGMSAAGMSAVGRSAAGQAPRASAELTQPAENGEAALYDHARTVAVGYGLSSRELDVLMLLVKGRNKAYISKTLYISDNTTLTHMKNIYRKMGVHSHQELLDLIETR